VVRGSCARARGFVVAECALAVVAAGRRGVAAAQPRSPPSVDPGFDPHGVLSVRLEFPPEPPPTAEERLQASPTAPVRARGREQQLTDFAARVSAIPGVERSGSSTTCSSTAPGNKSITIPGRSTEALAGAGQLNDGAVSAGFFGALRVPLSSRPYLTRDDALTKIRALWSPIMTDLPLADKERLAVAEPVVVDEAFVRRFFRATIDWKRFCIESTNKTLLVHHRRRSSGHSPAGIGPGRDPRVLRPLDSGGGRQSRSPGAHPERSALRRAGRSRDHCVGLCGSLIANV